MPSRPKPRQVLPAYPRLSCPVLDLSLLLIVTTLDSQHELVSLPVSLKQDVVPRWGNPGGGSTIMGVAFAKKGR